MRTRFAYRLARGGALAVLCAAYGAIAQARDEAPPDTDEPAEGPPSAVYQAADAYVRGGDLDEAAKIALIDKARVPQVAASDQAEASGPAASSAEGGDGEEPPSGAPSAQAASAKGPSWLVQIAQVEFTYADLFAWDDNAVEWTRDMMRGIPPPDVEFALRFAPQSLRVRHTVFLGFGDLAGPGIAYDFVDLARAPGFADPELARLVAEGDRSVIAPLIGLESGLEGAALTGGRGVRVRDRIVAPLGVPTGDGVDAAPPPTR